jgi:hypothetical protein
MRARTVLAVLGLVLLATALPAAAHVHVCISESGQSKVLVRGEHCGSHDKYEVTLGWRSEPPFTGLKNGLDLGVKRVAPSTGHGHGNATGNMSGDHHADGGAVTNITTLTARYEFGGKTFPLELRPQFGRAGWYTDDITPTRAGTYTVRVTGTILGTAVNFTVEPETVAQASSIEFPEPSPDLAALQAKVTALEQKVESLSRGSTTNGGTPTPAPNRGAPGFEPLLLLAGLGAAALAVRSRRD